MLRLSFRSRQKPVNYCNALRPAKWCRGGHDVAQFLLERMSLSGGTPFQTFNNVIGKIANKNLSHVT